MKKAPSVLVFKSEGACQVPSDKLSLGACLRHDLEILSSDRSLTPDARRRQPTTARKFLIVQNLDSVRPGRPRALEGPSETSKSQNRRLESSERPVEIFLPEGSLSSRRILTSQECQI